MKWVLWRWTQVICYTYFFAKETLESLSKEVLKPIIIKYTNVIGYYVLKDGKFVQSSQFNMRKMKKILQIGLVMIIQTSCWLNT